MLRQQSHQNLHEEKGPVLQTLEFIEEDESGNTSATYTCQISKEKDGRVAEVLEVSVLENNKVTAGINGLSKNVHLQLKKLVNVFLPAGYPASVTEDYLEYQIYDSLQAFSSSIAGLLSSRAVLQGFGVGDATASPTSAMLLSILQADIFNDSALVLDCLSPAFPKTLRIATLCLSGSFRALCGVAGGGSKASLSAHFAKLGNVGELSAKDSSQETVISLFGMLAGSIVVSHVTSTTATWVALILLIGVHLATNYKAVRAVCLRTLNQQRANLVISTFYDTGRVLTPAEVSKHERIFERPGVLRWMGKEVLGHAEIGGKLKSMIALLGEPRPVNAMRSGAGTMALSDLANKFQKEKYILWYDNRRRKVAICLKGQVTSGQQLKAWAHALLAVRNLHQDNPGNLSKPPSSGKAVEVLEECLDKLGNSFEFLLEELKLKGWDLVTVGLETKSGYRIGLNSNRIVDAGGKKKS